jgi:hypothetical protein
MTIEALEEIFSPEVNERLDAMDPTILDFSSLTTPESVNLILSDIVRPDWITEAIH